MLNLPRELVSCVADLTGSVGDIGGWVYGWQEEDHGMRYQQRIASFDKQHGYAVRVYVRPFDMRTEVRCLCLCHLVPNSIWFNIFVISERM